MANELALLVDARSSLERARTLSEVKEILDVAVAARKYAEARKLGEESLAYAQEVINRATRRMGEMLAEKPPHPPGPRPRELGSNVEPNSPRVRDLGITKIHRAHRSVVCASRFAATHNGDSQKRVVTPRGRVDGEWDDVETVRPPDWILPTARPKAVG